MLEANIILLLVNFKKVIISLFFIALITSLSWTYIRRFYYISFFPGPRALPIIGNALLLNGSLEDVSKLLFIELRKFGPIFRFWLSFHPIVIVSKPDHVQKVLTSPGALEKAWLMRHIAGSIFGDGILLSLVPKWKRHRKIVKSGFGQGIINSFLPVFVKQSNILVDVLKKELNNKDPFDAFTYLSRATLDTVCDAAMRVDINSQRTNSEYIDALDSELEIMVERAYKIWLHSPFVFNLTSLAKKHRENTQILWGVVDKLIAEKRKNRANNVENIVAKHDTLDINSGLQKNPLRKPVLDFLLDYMETDKEFTCKQLREEINIVILGAYETAARSLSYMFMALGKHKDIQQRLYDEIFSIFGHSERPIDLSDFQNLQYMEMVIKESMRFFPTIPYIVREITNDIQVDKYTIPKGTTCLVSIAYLHYDEEIWENPSLFDPDRFLPENIKKRHQFAYIPFSAGPRDCIGVKYAMMFMKTVLTTVLRNYEIHTDLEFEKCEYRLELSLKLIGGHLVKIKPRNHK